MPGDSAASANVEAELQRLDQLLSSAEDSARSGDCATADKRIREVSASLKKLVKKSDDGKLLRAKAEPLHQRLKLLNDLLKDEAQRKTAAAAAEAEGASMGLEDDNPFKEHVVLQTFKKAEEAQLKLALEREVKLDQLAKDMIDLEELFTELNKLVLEQGEEINLIEDHVDEAVEDAETGRDQLADGVVNRRKSRKKKIIIVAIAAVAILILIMIVVVLFTRL